MSCRVGVKAQLKPAVGVHSWNMKRFPLAIAAGVSALCLIAPGVASAQIVELGQTSSAPVAAPSLPARRVAGHCLIVLPRTTAVQTETNGVLNPTKVTKDGWIVAFTVGLSKLTSNASTELSLLKGLDAQLGRAAADRAHGPQARTQEQVHRRRPERDVPRAAVPGLGAPGAAVAAADLHHDDGRCRSRRARSIGLTVLTWAPVLTYNLTASKYSYRQSRRANCINAAGHPDRPDDGQRQPAVPVQLHGDAGPVLGDRGRQPALPQDLRRRADPDQEVTALSPGQALRSSPR